VGQPLGVGIIGLGVISSHYVRTLEALTTLRLAAIADLDAHRARVVADNLGGVRALSVEQLLADPDVEVVVNLTPPAGHAQIALAAIAAGKAVYNEKPLATTVAQGREILDTAARAGIRVGAAPDTVLGTGIQTARHAIDAGAIGTPTAAVATFLSAGHESWHPNPDFYYAVGGGPLLDMGPYYVTALVTLFGPIASVVGAGSASRSSRTIGSGPRAGETVPVDVQTHVSGILTHASGVLSTITMSFDAVATQAAPIEVHGTAGSLIVPDPNTFEGEVRRRALGDTGWTPLPVSAGYTTAGRGLGVAELMAARDDADVRTSEALALHVLDVMESVLRSAQDGRAVDIVSAAHRPTAVPLTAEPGVPPK
jgi:predicted dehydrogenase